MKLAAWVKCMFLILLMFSCKDKQKDNRQIAADIVHQNFIVLMDSISYFDMSKIPGSTIKSDSITVSLYSKTRVMDLQESIPLFKEKFKLKQEKFDPIYFDITNIPVSSVDHYPVHLVHGLQESEKTVDISLYDCLIDQSGKFASITVVKSRGIGAKLEIYFFKKLNGIWIFDGKKLLAVG